MFDYKLQVQDMSRRYFLGKSALAGAGIGMAFSGCTNSETSSSDVAAALKATRSKVEVPPGQLDDYYSISSGGHSGEMRIYGVPSGRTLKRIPVFNIDCMVGWGITNESKAIIGTRSDGSLKYKTGDTHHVHGSYTDGTYDGKYFWVNDKLNARVARIRGDTFECDKITDVPNIQGQHGLFPDKRDPADPSINHTTRVFAGGEFHIPLPNNGQGIDSSEKYGCLFSCLDAETMEVRWQVRIDGNMDLVATSYDGVLAGANQYNMESGVRYEDMMSNERDSCVFFHVARIESAIKEGKFINIGVSKVPVIDGRSTANQDPKTAVTCYVPVPKNPHGVNASPDGKYFVCSGKLSPTATVIDLEKVQRWFEGKIKDPRDCVVAEPEIGLGPLHTAFDGRGNAYTTLFLDSQIVKWNVDAAIKQFNGDKKTQVVLDRIDVHYQPGHGYTSMGETKESDGMLFNSGNKFSKDRFLPVGPLHVETEQLIDISGDKMVLLSDHTAYPEPHDAIIVRRNLVKTRQIYNIDDFPNAVKDPKSQLIERTGKRVTIHLASQAPAFSMREFNVKQGDEVTIILTNHDKVEDLTHGFGIPMYDINFIVNPQETKSVTFNADKPGVFWCYCTHFCHALHLEMRSRLIVEPR
ncbi:nitrous-oxide reductase [Laribacter hongkongensis]|uniref:TAT-dependent nitrous-oxide reductase n=1 Tax=Laribacter hongkongensis TaxID=168471 RepID=UPI001EFE2F66|nr:TAT-dependent nitrous-oxide reductase [Laribacter hongkongensis]MCG9054170.1 nitrous-oxide reductase [Laribacter hongkongensis]